jgi:predicted ATP-grasp superfamily ATP-dependent carboligase
LRLFLYEWITGGGLVEETGALPRSLLTEGSAMLAGLAADFAALKDCQVSVLRDIRLDDLVLDGCQVHPVYTAQDQREEFARLAAAADYTLLVAPEFDNILLSATRLATRSGATLLGPGEEFVALTANKSRTAAACAAAGIRTPEAVVLAADAAKLPHDFAYPAVLKPEVGAGSQHTLLLESARDQPPPYPWARRLERFCPGIPVSVAFLCGLRGRTPLPVCRQHLSSDDRFTYLGGSLLSDTRLAARATRLAARVLDALPAATGYVGVDLVLGEAPDGSEDFLIEVNPRCTTSYVGLRAATTDNLAAAMVACVEAEAMVPTFRQQPLEFLADGTICYSAW